MRLVNGELRPGVVLRVLDNHGTIHASVEGLFVEEDEANLPPIYIWPSNGTNSFTTPKPGQNIWVLFFTDNPEQLYWFRRDDFTDGNGTLNPNGNKYTSDGKGIQDQIDVEVVANCKSRTGCATIYFSDGTGWIIQNQEVVIKLTQEGSIIISNGTPHSAIEVNDSGISLGSLHKSAHPCPHGDKVAELFDKVIASLNLIQQVAEKNPYCASIGAALKPQLETYKDDSRYINSEYITLD